MTPHDDEQRLIEFSHGLAYLAVRQEQISGLVPGAIDGSKIAIITACYSLSEEVHELGRELGWRPWRVEPEPDPGRVLDECADVLAFLGTLIVVAAKVCDIPPALFAELAATRYQRVSERNISRFIGLVENVPDDVGAGK